MLSSKESGSSKKRKQEENSLELKNNKNVKKLDRICKYIIKDASEKQSDIEELLIRMTAKISKLSSKELIVSENILGKTLIALIPISTKDDAISEYIREIFAELDQINHNSALNISKHKDKGGHCPLKAILDEDLSVASLSLNFTDVAIKDNNVELSGGDTENPLLG